MHDIRLPRLTKPHISSLPESKNPYYNKLYKWVVRKPFTSTDLAFITLKQARAYLRRRPG